MRKFSVSQIMSMAGIAALIILFSVVLVVCHNLGEDYRANSVYSPAGCFKVTFDFAPDDRITGLQGSGDGFRDDLSVFLAFHTDPATFVHLLGGRFHPLSRSRFCEVAPVRAADERSSSEEKLPSWWIPLVSPSAVCLSSTSFHPSFSWGNAYATYDAATRQAYFYWSGSD